MTKNIAYIINNTKSIDCLNDYCLGEVFSYLPFDQLINIKTVCRRWKQAVEITCNRKKIFKANHIDKLDPSNYIKWEKYIECVLKLCGKNLKTLCVSGLQNNKIPMLINQNCPNLLSLGLGYYDYKKKKYYIDNLKKLKSIRINNIGHADVLFLNDLNKLPKTIKNIKLYNYSGNGITVMTPSSMIKDDSFSLTLNRYFINNHQMKNIINNLSSLVEICLSGNNYYPNVIESLCLLRNLKSIDLSGISDVDDQLLNNLSKSCKKIKILDVSYCENITDNGLLKLLKLKELEILRINNLNNITGNNFSYFLKLKELYCRNCFNLNIDNIKFFFNNHSCLRILDAKSSSIPKEFWYLNN